MVATMNSRRTTLVVALALALLTGWLTIRYLSNLQSQTYANTAPVQIVVAAHDIPARVPITADMLTTATRPASAVDPSVVTSARSVVGTLSLITISQGQAITHTMVGNPSEVGLTVRLTPGMRAVNVQVDKIKGLAGLVQPGDRVDVIAQPPKNGNAPPPAAAILRGVRVLAVGTSLESTSATPAPGADTATTVTLEVTPKQADLLVMADLNANLRLALRSAKEPVNSAPTESLHWDSAPQVEVNSPSGGNAQNVAAEAAFLRALAGPNSAQQSHAAGPVAPAPPAQRAASPQSNGGVQVIDGDHVTGAGER